MVAAGKGPAGEVVIEKGVIAAKRHIHFNVEEAAAAGVEDKQIVSVKVGKEGERSVIFGDVVVRVSPKVRRLLCTSTPMSPTQRHSAAPLRARSSSNFA